MLVCKRHKSYFVIAVSVYTMLLINPFLQQSEHLYAEFAYGGSLVCVSMCAPALRKDAQLLTMILAFDDRATAVSVIHI